MMSVNRHWQIHVFACILIYIIKGLVEFIDEYHIKMCLSFKA